MKPLLSCFAAVVLLGAQSLEAQWIQTNGPYVGIVTCFAVSGSNLFAATHNGVFFSTNNGTSWATVNTGLTGNRVNALAVNGSNPKEERREAQSERRGTLSSTIVLNSIAKISCIQGNRIIS